MPSSRIAETYLRIILELEEERVPPIRARIGERTLASLPSVSQNIARLERDGLIETDANRRLRLTPGGRRMAVAVLRRQRLAELLLVSLIGLPHDQAHLESVEWGHVLTTAAERHIHQRLGHPGHTPCGLPVPGLSDLVGDGPARADQRL
ncbi:metal-dependent transcriptional regulator [Actinoplanes sp. NPDC026670]|uniref:metal-dependent transcriptional regulator n=1 Tax=Actinoplanes sp. NPDC026670 TaxID=3154700 RepID=UPI00340A5FEC